MKRLFAGVALLILATSLSTWAADSDIRTLAGGPWQVSVEKGELRTASLGGVTIISGLGKFRVAEKPGISSFADVAMLRAAKPDRLDYEGLADDGKYFVAEFGETITVGDELRYDLYIEWLPPTPWPVYAVEGEIEFPAKLVTGVESGGKKFEIKRLPGELMLPSGDPIILRLADGQRLQMTTTGVSNDGLRLARHKDALLIRFTESRDYCLRKPPSTKGRQRHMHYWLWIIRSHRLRFSFKVH